MKKTISLLLMISLIFTGNIVMGQSIVHENDAKILYDLNLFQGISSTEFKPDLDSMSNREQAMTIIARALQWELNMSSKSPFSDVSNWAQPYVAKAYQMGITKGISATEFGGSRNVTSRELATWMLRALGYDPDDAWNNTIGLSKNVGTVLRSDTMNNAINRDVLVGMLYSFMKEGKVISKSKTLIEEYIEKYPDYKSIAERAGLIGSQDGEVMEFVLVEKTDYQWDPATAMMKTVYSYDRGLIDSEGNFYVLITVGTSGMISTPGVDFTNYYIKDITINVPFSGGRAVGSSETISIPNVTESFKVIHTNQFLRVTGTSRLSNGVPQYSISTVFKTTSSGVTGNNNQVAMDKLKIGIIFDNLGIENSKLNKLAWDGVSSFAKFINLPSGNYSYEKVASDDDLNGPFEKMDIANKDIVIANGFIFNEVIEKYAKMYPNKQFVIIDDITERANATNVSFKEEEGSFLAGVAAGLKAKEIGASKVGFIGGMDFGLIQKFEAGFEAGVKAVAPNMELIIQYIGTFTESVIAKSEAAKMYDNGVAIIYHASGPAGLGVIEEAKSRTIKGQEAWVIGVDYDQYDEGIYSMGKSVVLTSMIKRIDRAVFNVCDLAEDGKLNKGTLLLGLYEDGIGFPELNPNLSADIKKKIYDYEGDVMFEDIIVPTVPSRLK